MSNVANPSKSENSKDTNLASTISESANQAGTYLADKASEAGKFVQDKAGEASKYMSENAKSLASSAMDSANDAACYASKRAEDARCAVGSSFKSVGDSIRSAAPEGSGMHDAADSFATGLENAGKYLEEQDFSHMAEDVTNMIRRNPIPAICIAAGLGFLLARACTPSSRS
ncbi:hypothetical protein [Anatilimnocola floriformis]|uniref:hypothetical protein n=1 Tax=Anatilimnocola floriformis TaxID=2948575 RepID=UPI0020C1FC0A|nr:hypothetical protein [Anatilimnocola floriformis]